MCHLGHIKYQITTKEASYFPVINGSLMYGHHKVQGAEMISKDKSEHSLNAYCVQDAV